MAGPVVEGAIESSRQLRTEVCGVIDCASIRAFIMGSIRAFVVEVLEQPAVATALALKALLTLIIASF